MLESSLISILGISIPEEYIFLIITSLLVGRRDVINHKSISQIVRILIVVGLTVACTNVLVGVVNSILLKVIVQIVFFVLVYTFVMGMKWYEASVGILIYTVFVSFAQLISSTVSTLITGISYMELDQATMMAVLFTLIERILEVTLILILVKRNIVLINFEGIYTITKSMMKTLAKIHIYLIVPMLQPILVAEWYLKATEASLVKFVLSVSISVFWIAIDIYNLQKQSNIIQIQSERIKSEKEKNSHNLLTFENMVDENENNLLVLKEQIRRYKGMLIKQI